MSLQKRVTRSIEEALYQKLLYYGYTPDREVYAGDEVGFQDKQKEIKETKGFCVSLFGHGVSQDRGNKFLPEISILGLGVLTGSLGNDPVAHYKPTLDESAYSKIQGIPTSSNYRFEVTLSSNKASQDNFLEQLRVTALPNRIYIPFYDDPENGFLITYSFVRQAPDFSDGLIQKIYLYEAVDVFEEQLPVPETGEISKIKEIEVIDPNDSETLIDID